MKSKLLHMCAMVLVVQNIVEASDIDDLGENKGHTSATTASEDVKNIEQSIAKLKEDVSEIQLKLSEANIDDTALTKAQNGQTALTTQLEDITGQASLESKFDSLQKKSVEAEILLTKLKGGNLSTQESLESRLKKLSDEHKTIFDGIKDIEAKRTANIASIDELTSGERAIDKVIDTVTEAKSKAEQLRKKEENISMNLSSVSVGKAKKEDLERLQILTETFSEQISDIQEKSAAKAVRGSVVALKKELLKKADAEQLKKISNKLSDAAEIMSDRTDIAEVQAKVKARSEQIEAKADKLEAAIAEMSSVALGDIGKDINVTVEKISPLRSAIAQQIDNVLEAQNSLNVLQNEGVPSDSFSYIQKTIDAEISKKSDAMSVDNLKTQVSQMRSLKDVISANARDITSTIDGIETELAVMEVSKASTEDISKLFEIYSQAQVELQSLKRNVENNSETLGLQQKAYDELIDTIESVSADISSLYSIFHSHLATGEVAVTIQLQKMQTTLESNISNQSIDLDLLRIKKSQLQQTFSELQNTLRNTLDTLDRKIAANDTLRAQLQESAIKLQQTQEQINALEEDLSNDQATLAEKEAALEAKKVENANFKARLETVGTYISYDLVNKDFLAFSHDMNLQNVIPKLCAIDCTLVNSGDTLEREDLTYIKGDETSGIIDCKRVGKLAISTTGTGKLTITTTIEESQNISEYEVTGNATTTIELSAAGDVAYNIDAGMSVDSVVLTTDHRENEAVHVPYDQLAIVSAIDASATNPEAQQLTSTTSAIVTDPKITELATTMAVVKADLANRNAKLQAIGGNSGISMDLLTPNYKDFAYSVDVSNKIKGGEVSEINNCLKKALNSAEISSDGKVTYTKIGTVSDDIEKETGGTISFTQQGNIQINTVGVGTLQFTAGVKNSPSYSLSTAATTTIAAENLLNNSITYTISNSNTANLLRVARIALVTDVVAASMPVSIVNPTVETTSSGSTKALAATVLETKTDSAIENVMTQQNDQIDTLNTDKIALEATHGELTTENARLTGINTTLTRINDNLKEDVAGYQQTKQSLEDEKDSLTNGGIEKDLEDRNTKLQALGSDNALSIDLITPTFDSFSYTLKVRNMLKSGASSNNFNLLPYSASNGATRTLTADSNTQTITYDLSKTISDASVFTIAENKATAASDWVTKNSSVITEIANLTSANEALTQQNANLTAANSILSSENSELAPKNATLASDIATLKTTKESRQANLDTQNAKLTAIGNAIGATSLGLSDLINPDYENFEYQLKVRNTIPQVSKVDTTTVTPPAPGSLEYTKKISTAARVINFPSKSWESMTYGLGSDGVNRFVAVEPHYIAYSENGKNWQAANIPPTYTYFTSVTHGVCSDGVGLFVAIAKGAAAYSKDGKSWDRVELPEKDAIYGFVIHGACSDNVKRFVAIAGMGGLLNGAFRTFAAYSEDGKNWEAAKTDLTEEKFGSITYGMGSDNVPRFVAISSLSDNNIFVSQQRIRYSEDGQNWHLATFYDDGGILEGLTYGVCTDNVPRFVVINRDKTWASYSEDGKTWTNVKLPTNDYWSSISYGLCSDNVPRFVAIASSALNTSRNALYSEDGKSWINVKLPADDYWLPVVYGVCSDGVPRFVTVAGHDNLFQEYVMKKDNTSSNAAYSEDGKVWRKATLPVATKWIAIEHGLCSDGIARFVAIADGDLAYSEDGIHWSNTEDYNYESGGILKYANKGDVAITTLGLGTFTFTGGVIDSKKSPNECLNSTFSLSSSDLTGDPIEYTFTEGIKYLRSSLTYPISIETPSNEMKHTKNWNVILRNDGTSTTTEIPEIGGSLEYPAKNGAVTIATKGSGTLWFTSGAEGVESYSDSNQRTYTLIPTGNTGLSYLLGDGLTTTQVHYSYDTTSDVIIQSLGNPATTAASSEAITCALTKVVADPSVMALATEVAALKEAQSSGTSYEDQIKALGADTQELKERLDGDGTAENVGLRKQNEDLEAKYKVSVGEKNNLTMEKSDLTKEKDSLSESNGVLKTQIAKLEEKKNSLQAKIDQLDGENLPDRTYTDDIKAKLTLMEAIFGIDLASVEPHEIFKELLHFTIVNGKEAVKTTVTSANISDDDTLTCNLSVHVSSEFNI